VKKSRTESTTANQEGTKPLLDPTEVARWLGVSAAWVRDHATRKSPRLPTIKVGKMLRFRPADVENFIQDCWSAGDLRIPCDRL
jgi:predicted DNA-binding transcriptional regulator AlpA